MLRLRRPRSALHTARRALALVLAAGALLLALRPEPPPPASAAAAWPAVTVARTDLPAGTVLSAEHLAPRSWPPDVVPDGVVSSPDLLTGRVLAAGVRAGEPVTDVRLVGAGLTSLLPPGQVGVPVRPADLAVTALVRTGDRVDVLATAPDAATAEVVAAAALVLATPAPADDGPVEGLLLLAVDEGTAARLAAAGTTATLTLTFPSP